MLLFVVNTKNFLFSRFHDVNGLFSNLNKPGVNLKTRDMGKHKRLNCSVSAQNQYAPLRRRYPNMENIRLIILTTF